MELVTAIKILDAMILLAGMWMRSSANQSEAEGYVDELMEARGKAIKGQITPSEATAMAAAVGDRLMGKLDAAIAALPVPTHESYTGRGQR